MCLGSKAFCASGFAAIAALTISAAPALSEKVGVTAAVNPTVTGQPPGGSLRQLQIGADVVRNERIRSSGQGSMQLIFIDKTTLTLSPNCDITINEFVYNPSASSGHLAVTMGKGLLRFVGGQISHSQGANITTPTASMGIRGGIVLVNSTNGKTTIVHLYGTTTITTGSNSITISKPGLYVDAGGGQISAPKPAPPGLIASYNAHLQSKGDQTGGTSRGHVTADKLQGSTGGPGSGFSQSDPGNRSNPNTQPQPQTVSSSLGGISPSGPGGSLGGGGGGGGVGGPSGPAWGQQFVAPGQGNNLGAGPPGQVLKGIKGH